MSSNKSDYQWKFVFSCVIIVFLIAGLLFSWAKSSKLQTQVDKLTATVEAMEDSDSHSDFYSDSRYEVGVYDGRSEGYIDGLEEGFSMGQLVGMFKYRYDGLLLGITGEYTDDYFYSIYTDDDPDVSFKDWIDEQLTIYDSAYDRGYLEGEKDRARGLSARSFGGSDMPTIEDVGYCAGYYTAYIGTEPKP